MESKEASASPEVPMFDPSADPTTVQQAFQECSAAAIRSCEWADAIDRKVVAVFTVATVIAGVAPIATPKIALSLFTIAGLLGATTAWTMAVAFCWRAYAPRAYGVGPDAHALFAGQWLARSLTNYQWYSLYHLGVSFNKNKQACDAKARLLGWAMWSVFAEVILLSLVRVLA